VPGIVLPPEVINLTREIVLGCFATVEYRGKFEPAVVFDISPHFKLGEMSPCLARRLGINDDPNNGGVDTQEIHYRFWPGVPANIDGKQFELTPMSRASRSRSASEEPVTCVREQTPTLPQKI
jgi:hypothetical protein